MDDEAVWEVVEGDPRRLTDAVEPNLDPAPADVQAELDSVRSGVAYAQSKVDTVAIGPVGAVLVAGAPTLLSDEF